MVGALNYPPKGKTNHFFPQPVQNMTEIEAKIPRFSSQNLEESPGQPQTKHSAKKGSSVSYLPPNKPHKVNLRSNQIGFSNLSIKELDKEVEDFESNKDSERLVFENRKMRMKIQLLEQMNKELIESVTQKGGSNIQDFTHSNRNEDSPNKFQKIGKITLKKQHQIQLNNRFSNRTNSTNSKNKSMGKSESKPKERIGRMWIGNFSNIKNKASGRVEIESTNQTAGTLATTDFINHKPNHQLSNLDVEALAQRIEIPRFTPSSISTARKHSCKFLPKRRKSRKKKYRSNISSSRKSATILNPRKFHKKRMTFNNIRNIKELQYSTVTSKKLRPILRNSFKSTNLIRKNKNISKSRPSIGAEVVRDFDWIAQSIERPTISSVLQLNIPKGYQLVKTRSKKRKKSKSLRKSKNSGKLAQSASKAEVFNLETPRLSSNFTTPTNNDNIEDIIQAKKFISLVKQAKERLSKISISKNQDEKFQKSIQKFKKDIRKPRTSKKTKKQLFKGSGRLKRAFSEQKTPIKSLLRTPTFQNMSNNPNNNHKFYQLKTKRRASHGSAVHLNTILRGKRKKSDIRSIRKVLKNDILEFRNEIRPYLDAIKNDLNS